MSASALRWLLLPVLAVALLLSPLTTAVADGGEREISPAGAGAPRPSASPSAWHVGDEVCLSAEVDGGSAQACARRHRFGADWTLEASDTGDDGRPVRVTIGLDVVDGPDQSAVLRNDLGGGITTSSSGAFRPRVGRSLDDVTVEVCVVVRFGRDRCATHSATLPQLTGRATPAQRARLEQLLFELPLTEFMAVREQEGRSGVDRAFDWETDGCSGGPLTPVLDARLGAACVRHDFGYRNFGQLAYEPTDDLRRRVDEQLAVDAAVLGQAGLASGLADSLQRFAAPVFYGTDLVEVWPVPAIVIDLLGLERPLDPEA